LQAGTAAAIDKLNSTLPGKVFLPGSANYTSSIESYFFKTARQSPASIVKPTSAEDVSAAVKILAASPGVKIAIRSGGHTPNPNQSNVDAGVTIDLRDLNALKQSEDREDVLQVGGGAEWDSVYGLLEKSGRSAVGSRESSVGVGGFITGGTSSCSMTGRSNSNMLQAVSLSSLPSLASRATT
jgi:FAD/FMN-containing dehydrogenase